MRNIASLLLLPVYQDGFQIYGCIYSLLPSLSSRREKGKRVWKLSRLLYLDREYNMSWREKERADTGLVLSFRLRVAAPTLLFAGLSSQMRVWCKTPFGNSPHNGGHNFRLSLDRLWLVFNSHHYLVASLSQLTFKTESCPYFCLVSEGRTYPFPVVSHLRRNFRTAIFFQVILITEVIHWLAYNESFGLSHSEVSWPFCRFSLCLFFSFFFFLSLSPEISLLFSF